MRDVINVNKVVKALQDKKFRQHVRGLMRQAAFKNFRGAHGGIHDYYVSITFDADNNLTADVRSDDAFGRYSTDVFEFRITDCLLTVDDNNCMIDEAIKEYTR